MKKFIASALAIVTAATLSACSQSAQNSDSMQSSQNAQTNDISSSNAGASSTENSSGSDKQKDERGEGEELYSFMAGDNEVTLVLLSDTGGDDENYRGSFALKTASDSEQLTTPMIAEMGFTVSKTPANSFQTEKITVGDKQYDLVIFMSDKKLEERLATCYVIDESGRISILANVFPQISGDITTDGEYIVFSAEKKYTVDIENSMLVEAE